MIEECWQLFRYELGVTAVVAYVLIFLARSAILKLIVAFFSLIASPFRVVATIFKRRARIAQARYRELHWSYSQELTDKDHMQALRDRARLFNENRNVAPINTFELGTTIRKIESAIADIQNNVTAPVLAEADDELLKNGTRFEKSRSLRAYRSALRKLPGIDRHLSKLTSVLQHDRARIDDLERTNKDVSETLRVLGSEADRELNRPALFSARSIAKPLATGGFIAIAGLMLAAFNAMLIAGPMQELLGGESEMLGINLAYPAALTFILGEVVAGVLALEWFGITSWGILPLRGALRRIMGSMMLVLLTLCAYAEVSLVGLRSRIAEGRLAIRDDLAAVQTFDSTSIIDAIPSVEGQLILAFVLPYLTALGFSQFNKFVPIARIVLQQVYGWALMTISWIFAVARRFVGRMETLVMALFRTLFVVVPEKLIAAVVAVYRWLAQLRPRHRSHS